MPALAAGNVEDSRSVGQAKNVDNASCLGAVTLQCEDGLIFEEIPGVEIRLPPLLGFLQKKTGSL